MKRALLSSIAIIMAFSVIAQETEYRITKKVSKDCDKDIIYLYDNSYNHLPSSITEIIDLWSIENIDSLHYDADGRLIKRDTYEIYEGGEPKFISSTEYTYNDDGLMENSVYSEGDRGKEYYTYNYDENNRLINWEHFEDDVLDEKCEYSYDANDLITQKIYFEDYGWGLTSYQKVNYSYEEDKLINEEYHYYMEDIGWYLYTKCDYEYENENCVSYTTYYDGSLYHKEEYLHDPEISYESAHMFIIPNNDPIPTPKHVNMITEHNEYAPAYESNEIVLTCNYGYAYEELTTRITDNTLAFDIYPNPVKDYINIVAENIDLVELYDVYGRKLFSEEKSNNVKIDMNNFSNGIYFIKICSEGKSSVKKIVKEL